MNKTSLDTPITITVAALSDQRLLQLCGPRQWAPVRLPASAEIDHVVPYALGGSAEPDNLRLLCAAHHRYRHRHARLAAARR